MISKSHSVSNMSPLPTYSTIIFDLGDVLFSWSSQTKTSISSKVLRKILSSPTWFDFERGRVTQDDCYARVGAEFSLDPREIAKAFHEARESLQANDELIALIREMKAQSHGQLRVFAMSNISIPDYDFLRTKPADWSVFDDVFTSGAAGERKPNLGFYRHVLSKTLADPYRTIFVDDKLDNVLSARSVGMHGIVFDDHKKVTRALRNLIGDPTERGRAFLARNAGHFESITDNGIVLMENFAQLLILEATHDRNLVSLNEHARTWNFFIDKPLLTTEDFPFDLDTTSLGLTVLQPVKEVVSSVMDEMLEYLDEDGIIQTYFDHTRPRFDPVVCVNALSLFYKNGRGSELHQTLQWVHEVLLNRAYLEGTRYYEGAECFLFFLSRLLSCAESEDLDMLMRPLLTERLRERIGSEGDALALAMRIIACASVGIKDEVDLRMLLPLQCEDGGWEIGWVYKYGSSGVRIGNRGLTTALAINAILAVEKTAERPHSSEGVRIDSPSATLRADSPTLDKLECATQVTSGNRSCIGWLKPLLQWLWHGGNARKPMRSFIQTL